jgi:hypothetical protein
LGTLDSTVLTPQVLAGFEPSITFLLWPEPNARACLAPTAQAAESAVDYAGIEFSYAAGTLSASGTTFGVNVVEATGQTYYYVNGQERDWTATNDTAGAPTGSKAGIATPRGLSATQRSAAASLAQP